MKDNNFTTNPNTVISPENVQSLGECLAISALKFLRPYRAVNHCYFGLLRDIRNKNNPNYYLSDGYNFAQSATWFLCGHIGKRLGDTVVNKYRKLVTVKQECYRVVNRLTAKYARYKNSTLPIFENILVDNKQYFENDMDTIEKSYDRAEKLIVNMGLTENQFKTLEYYMEDKGTTEISRLLCVAVCTLWRYRSAL